MYFLRGKLPWSGLPAPNKTEKYRRIMNKKIETPLEELCEGHPSAFRIYLEKCRAMTFYERPDYDYLRKLFLDARKEHNDPTEFSLEWLENQKAQLSTLTPLEDWQAPPQPDAGKTPPKPKSAPAPQASCSSV